MAVRAFCAVALPGTLAPSPPTPLPQGERGAKPAVGKRAARRPSRGERPDCRARPRKHRSTLLCDCASVRPKAPVDTAVRLTSVRPKAPSVRNDSAKPTAPARPESPDRHCRATAPASARKPRPCGTTARSRLRQRAPESPDRHCRATAPACARKPCPCGTTARSRLRQRAPERPDRHCRATAPACARKPCPCGTTARSRLRQRPRKPRSTRPATAPRTHCASAPRKPLSPRGRGVGERGERSEWRPPDPRRSPGRGTPPTLVERPPRPLHAVAWRAKLRRRPPAAGRRVAKRIRLQSTVKNQFLM